MTKKTYVETLPARFASALINNDYSGLSSADLDELQDIEQFCHKAVEVGQPYTSRYNGLICEVADYTFYY